MFLWSWISSAWGIIENAFVDIQYAGQYLISMFSILPDILNFLPPAVVPTVYVAIYMIIVFKLINLVLSIVRAVL